MAPKHRGRCNSRTARRSCGTSPGVSTSSHSMAKDHSHQATSCKADSYRHPRTSRSPPRVRTVHTNVLALLHSEYVSKTQETRYGRHTVKHMTMLSAHSSQEPMSSRRTSGPRALSRACMSALREGAAMARVAAQMAMAVVMRNFIVEYW